MVLNQCGLTHGDPRIRAVARRAVSVAGVGAFCAFAEYRVCPHDGSIATVLWVHSPWARKRSIGSSGCLCLGLGWPVVICTGGRAGPASCRSTLWTTGHTETIHWSPRILVASPCFSRSPWKRPFRDRFRREIIFAHCRRSLTNQES